MGPSDGGQVGDDLVDDHPSDELADDLANDLVDDELVERAVGGDRDALGALLERFGGEVAGRLQRNLGSRWRGALDVDDVMQVTFLEAFLQIDRLTTRNTRSSVAWLRRIAENNLRDAIRGLQCEKRAGPRSAGPRRAGPRSAGPRRAGPRSAGPRRAGPRILSRPARAAAMRERIPAENGCEKGFSHQQSRKRAHADQSPERKRAGPVASHGEPDDPRFARVYELIDSGSSAIQAAEQLGLPLGEVELILNLRGLR